MNDKELRDRLRDQLKNIHAQTGIIPPVYKESISLMVS